MILVTVAHVERRFADFVGKYAKVLEDLGYASTAIEEQVTHLAARLSKRDFRQYGSHPVHALHGGKRITRFYIKLAILRRPAMLERIKRWQAEYRAECAEQRKVNPCLQVFSFEAAYARQLHPSMAPFRQHFLL